MKLLICSVRDKAVGAYLQPFFCRSKGEAMRSFMDAINGDGGQPFAKHPEHYALYLHGEYDDVDGRFECVSDPELIVTGVECVSVGASTASAADAARVN